MLGTKKRGIVYIFYETAKIWQVQYNTKKRKRELFLKVVKLALYSVIARRCIANVKLAFLPKSTNVLKFKVSVPHKRATVMLNSVC